MPEQYPKDLAVVVHDRLSKTKRGSPGLNLLIRLFEVLYFTSLKTEESRPLQVRVVWEDPGILHADSWREYPSERSEPVHLDQPIPLTVANLVKLCQAFDPWSSSIAVHGLSETEIFIWGMFDQTVQFNMMLVRESKNGHTPPGLFQAVANGVADITVYEELNFIAHLVQDRIVLKQNDVLWSGPVHKRLLPGICNLRQAVMRAVGIKKYRDGRFWDASIAERYTDAISRLLINIQRYKHGGAVLITTTGLRDLNIKYKIEYQRLEDALYHEAVRTIWSYENRLTFNFEYELADRKTMPLQLYYDLSAEEGFLRVLHEELTGCIRFISSLANVDGLILLSPELKVRGFGVEILSKLEPKQIFRAHSAMAENSDLELLSPSHFGTRHRSMMRFCYSHQGSVGFVVSQDGDIRAITRVGAKLILWEDVKVHLLWGEDWRKGSGQDAPRKNKSAK
jgi:hypothetical protein